MEKQIMSKRVSICLFLFSSFVLFSLIPFNCAGAEGYWEQVDVKSGQGKNFKDRCGEQRVTISEGTFSLRKVYFAGVCNHGKEAIFSASASWTPPPKRLNPGEIQPFTISAKRGSNIPWFFLSLGLSISIDKPDCRCGFSCSGERQLGRVEANSRAKSDTATTTVKFKVPAGSKDASLAIRFCPDGSFHNGQPGFRYIYQWVQAEENNDGSASHKSNGKVEPETSEDNWSDYAKDFENYTKEEQDELIANMTSEQRAELARVRAGLKTEKPRDPTKKKTPQSVPEMNREQYLIKEWDFWQDEYRSFEKSTTLPLHKCLEEMKIAKDNLQLIKRSYENEFGRPLPGIDYTDTRYPFHQTRHQQEALKIYEEFKPISKEYKKAAKLEKAHDDDLRSFPLLNTPQNVADRDRVTREKNRLKGQLDQIKKKWVDKFHRDYYGPLKTKIIPDPQHHPLDTRKERRKVDKMEYEIKGGARYEKGGYYNGNTSTTPSKLSKPPEQDSAEPKKTNIPVDRSDEKESQSLGQKNNGARESQTLPSVRDKGVPKGHTTKYGF